MKLEKFNLSPAKRALLEAMLKEKNIGTAAGQWTISPRLSNEPAPLSFAQQRMWFLHQMEGSSQVYNVPMAFHLNGKLDLEAFEHSINKVIRRHEILRTYLQEMEGEVRQVVSPELELRIRSHDLRDIPSDERNEQGNLILVECGRERFDLTHLPLMRVDLIRLEDHDAILLINLHHLIIDEWSMEILFREISSFYMEEIGEKPSDLPELPIQYADFALWQLNWLKGAVIENQLGYWSKVLSGAPPSVNLHTDLPRPSRLSYRGAKESVNIPRDVLDRLRDLGRSERTTLFTLLLAAFNVLLFRFTGQTDILLGTPIANRRQIELEHLIGFFLNTIVLRIDLSGNPSFRQLLKRVNSVVLDAFDHQDLPFERLVEELKPDRDLSRHPLFQIAFVLQPAGVRDFHLSGIEVDRIQVEYGWSKFDLTLFMTESTDGLVARLEYSLDLFLAETIQRLLRSFEVLLDAIASNPDQPISSLRLLSVTDMRQVLMSGIGPSLQFSFDRLIHQLVEQQAKDRPQSLALIQKKTADNGENLDFALSFGELNRRANNLAHYLNSIGVGPGCLVGVFMHRNPEMIVALLGILKAGAAYIPLDPANPQERLAFLMHDAAPIVVLTQSNLADRLMDMTTRVVRVDQDWSSIESFSQDNPQNRIDISDRAYVIYTSGSTGLPKGVELEHLGLLNLVQWHIKEFQVTHVDRASQVAGLSFDASVWEIWPYLASGSCVVLLDDERDLAPRRLIDWLVRNKITISFLPTPIAESVLVENWPSETTLRILLTGGDRLHLFPPSGLPFRLINNYGPTETTVVASSTEVLPLESGSSTTTPLLPSIGRPISNVRHLVLDPVLNPVPFGVAGELYIGGLGVGRGYLNQPDLTAERFISYPTMIDSEDSAARFYRSGDLVRQLPDGNLEFLGRLDDQVKLRGLRIELGEIETILSRHPDIDQVAVGLREMEHKKFLAAYLVIKEGVDEPSGKAIRSFLSQKLPEYMLPETYTFLKSIPLTPNGKVDRSSLPNPNFVTPDKIKGHLPPRDALEAQICHVWESVLGIDRVGIEDNFFELGGHSLKAIRLVSKLEEEIGRQIPLVDVFQAPTVSGMAERLRQTKETFNFPTLTRHDLAEPAPLSSGQERMWFQERMGLVGSAYNVPMAFHSSSPIDPQALERSINAIVKRHSILRTTFQEIDGENRQVVTSELKIPVQTFDLSDLPESAQESEGKRLLKKWGQLPFDLEKGPLLRVYLITNGDRDQILLINLHHVVIDEWSTSVLLRELAFFYQAESAGKQVSLPDLPIQYSDFAIWQLEMLNSQLGTAQLNYWKEKLAGAPQVLDLPLDHPRPASFSYKGAISTHRLSDELAQSIRVLSKTEQTTLFSVLIAAFQTLLYRLSGQEDLLVGSPIANRNRTGITDLIGFFLNTILFRGNLSGNPSFRNILKHVSRDVLEALENQDFPFEKLVEEIRPQRDLSRHPLFQTMLVFHPFQDKKVELSDLGLNPIKLDYGTSKFDLTLFATEREHCIDLSLEYSSDLFEKATAERFLGQFEKLLKAITDNPEARVGELNILTESDTELLDLWNRTQTVFPSQFGIHQLIEEQAIRTPSAIAVEHPGVTSITYSELNETSNRLAHLLISKGVCPDTPVGIYMERSIESLISVLGILKSGGTCLPLDPAYPKARLEYICAETKITLILTTKDHPERLPGSKAEIVFVDGSSELANFSSQNPGALASGDNLAYVLYTSGSTGRPKGVMMGHRPLVNLISWQLSQFKSPLASRTLQLTSLNFDVSFQEIFSTWSAGGTLVVVEEKYRRDMEGLLKFIQNSRIERLFLPFVALQALAEVAVNRGIIPETLLEVITAGEQLQVTPEINIFFSRMPECELINQYGPTEAHVVSSFSLERHPAKWPQLPPIGMPIANTQIRLQNPYSALVPFGTVGEIYLAGDCLARGYFQRPDLTAERFVPDSHGMPGSRVYRTGDMGRYLPDGNILFLGRADHQVKIRGFRVELAEIELSLARHPLIRQVAVLALRSNLNDLRLVAFIVPDPGTSLQSSDLQVYLHHQLPEYMVPTQFQFEKELPLTPNGKIDRIALQKNYNFNIEQHQLDRNYVKPRNEVESQLASTWEKVLGLSSIGIHDNFFELGGHSLLAMRLFNQIERDTGYRLPLSLLFEAPTIAKLTERLSGEEKGTRWSPIVQIQPEGSDPPFICVHNFGGEVINLYPLAKLLGEKQPFIGLQALGLDGQAEPHRTIPEMAAYFIENIRSIRPRGPYRLGGYCFGGLVAYEMACQLQSQGEQVELLALIDSFAMARLKEGQKVSKSERILNFIRNLPFWLRDFLELGMEEKRVVIKRRFRKTQISFYHWLGLPAAITPRELIGDHAAVEEAPSHIRRLMEIHIVALAEYKPPRFDGKIDLFRVQTLPLLTYYPQDGGWNNFVSGGVTMHRVPGSHHNVMQPPHVYGLADALKTTLEQLRDSSD